MASPQSRPRFNPVIRSLAALGLVVAFLAAASYFRPPDSSAIPMGPTRAIPSETDAGQGARGSSIGWLESPDYRVQVFATEHGPRYDVYDASGRLIGGSLEADELYAIDPLLDPDNMLTTPMGLVVDEDL